MGFVALFCFILFVPVLVSCFVSRSFCLRLHPSPRSMFSHYIPLLADPNVTEPLSAGRRERVCGVVHNADGFAGALVL